MSKKLNDLSKKIGRKVGGLLPSKEKKAGRAKIAFTEIRIALGGLSGWSVRENKIVKQFKFRDFSEAFAFMTRCALEIHRLDHHPEWFNVYNKLHVELTTHDAGGVTTKDVELAKIMDKIAASFNPKEQV